METTVEKLEAMFLKSEADLEYIEKRLKLDFINNTAENGCPTEENPAVILESLGAIKAKHSTLCSQAREIAAAQKESMEAIRTNLSNVMKLIQHFEQTNDLEVQPLTESVQESAKILGSANVIETTTEVPSAVAASGQQQPLSEALPSVQKIKRLKMRVSGAKLKAQDLSLVELDRNGHIPLMM